MNRNAEIAREERKQSELNRLVQLLRLVSLREFWQLTQSFDSSQPQAGSSQCYKDAWNFSAEFRSYVDAMTLLKLKYLIDDARTLLNSSEERLSFQKSATVKYVLGLSACVLAIWAGAAFGTVSFALSGIFPAVTLATLATSPVFWIGLCSGILCCVATIFVMKTLLPRIKELCRLRGCSASYQAGLQNKFAGLFPFERVSGFINQLKGFHKMSKCGGVLCGLGRQRAVRLINQHNEHRLQVPTR